MKIGRSVSCLEPGPLVPKLNYVLNHYSPTSVTHFAHITELLREIAAQGCSVNLFIEKLSGGVLPNLQGVNVHAIKMRAPFLRHIELFARLCIARLRGFDTTFVRISAPAAIIAAACHRILGGKAVLWQSGMTHDFDRAQPLSPKKLQWFVTSAVPNYIARKSCHLFVTGPESMIDYYADVVGIKRSKIRLLYNDIDLARWQSQGDERSPKWFSDRFGRDRPRTVLLLVHRLSPVRRTVTYLGPLFEALKDKGGADWVLIVAGDGSELKDAKMLARLVGVSDLCLFLGAVPNSELPGLYRSADIFLNPTFVEGFPRVVIEAMAAGLPIVTTNAGGTSDLLGVRQRNLVVDRNSPRLFAEKTIELISDAGLRAEASKENLAEVERFSTPRVAAMYIELLCKG